MYENGVDLVSKLINPTLLNQYLVKVVSNIHLNTINFEVLSVEAKSDYAMVYKFRLPKEFDKTIIM